MFIVSMILMSAGYTLLYWGIDNFVSWMPSGETNDGSSSLTLGTDAPEIPLLLGFHIKTPQSPNASDPRATGHAVPLPFHPVVTSGPNAGKSRPVSGPTGSSGGTVQV